MLKPGLVGALKRDPMVDLPDGQIRRTSYWRRVHSCSKNISLRDLVDTALLIPPSRLERGAFRDRHERGAGCGGREVALDERRDADGEVVWS